MSPAHTRAWIETRRQSWRAQFRVVARSHAGVDRNEDQGQAGIHLGKSPAHTRAWIETASERLPPRTSQVARSHAGVDRNLLDLSLRVRHLVARSHAGVDRNAVALLRHPLRRVARSHAGVDRNLSDVDRLDEIAWSPAHTRAWIETLIRFLNSAPRSSPAHTRAWIETQARRSCLCFACVARSHAGVDRNSFDMPPIRHRYSRPLTRGRGSKHDPPRPCSASSGRPLTRGRGSKQPGIWEKTASIACRPLTRGRGSKRVACISLRV